MAASVTVGGKPATNVVVVDDGTITATVPPATAGGAVDVVVTTGGGSGTLPGGYTYGDPVNASVQIPTPIAVPVGVPTTYTTRLTNTGGKGHIGLQLRLHSDDGALVPADVVYETSDSNEWVTAVLTQDGGDLISAVETLAVGVDEDATSDVRITVNRDDITVITGSSTLTSAAGAVVMVATYEFDITAVPEPTIASVTPASGASAGGDAVTITGTGFTEE